MSSQNFYAPGAVDLSGLANRPAGGPGGPGGPAGGGPAGPAGPGTVVVDVTEQTFEAEVVQRSLTVPVVIDFWADWCQPCKQLSPVLEKLAAEYAGRFVLAKIDTEANQRLAAAVQVQSIPMVMGVIKGQPVPLFNGALPEADVRRYLDELLKVAAANGVSGTVPVDGPQQAPAEDEQPAEDPRYAKAEDALAAGDYDGAITAFETILAATPGDEIAASGKAGAALMKRIADLDPDEIQRTADEKPDDVSAQCRAADAEVFDGRIAEAFARLVATVKRASGDDRNAARQHLLDLFTVVGPKDPLVQKARRDLANALF